MPAGIVSSSFSPTAAIKLQEKLILFPALADVDYFSTNGTAGSGAQGAMSIASSVVGDAVKLGASGSKPLPHARMPTITVTDNSGTTLAVTVRIVGRRFGRIITQDLVAAAGVGTQTITGSHCIDEMVSAKIISIAANTTSDTVSIGFDSKRIGLPHPIKNIRSVKYLEKGTLAGTNDGSTPPLWALTTPFAADGSGIIATATLQASTIVFPTDSSISVYAAYSSTAIAVTDVYRVKYMPDGADDLGPNGYLA